MQGKFYKELWTMRFQKMLELEREGVQTYQSIVDGCGKDKSCANLKADLKKLVEDEKKHVKLVHQLLEIVERQAN